MITVRAYASCIAASSGLDDAHGPSASTVRRPHASGAAPNAPNSTLVNERFIALLISIDSMKPDAPSSAPAMISTLLPSAKPVADAARPAYEFSSEITTGMSAPPIGSTISTPTASAEHDHHVEDHRVRPGRR